jgi:hypothetical protein
MLDHINDPAHHAAVIDTRHAMRQREKRCDPSHLALAQQKQPAHQNLLERDSESHSLAD